MDMCYSGALVLPSSYAVMNEEEMSYTEGGWSDYIFRNNLKAAYANYKAAKTALRMGGLTMEVICKAAFTSAKAVVACYGMTINTVALCIGGIVAEIIASVALVAGINYIGNHRVWY